MGYEPPFDLDPHIVFRDLEDLPVLLRRGMVSVIMQKIGQADPKYDDLISGFNISAWSLTTAGRSKGGKKGKRTGGAQARLKKGTLDLTGAGLKLEEEKRHLPDTTERLARLAKWVDDLKTSDPDRATMTYEEYKARGRR